MSLLTQEILVRRRADAIDPDTGRPVPTFSQSTVMGALTRRTSRVDNDGGLVGSTDFTVYTADGADVDLGDELVVDGQTYVVIEEPYAVFHPLRKRVDHLEFRVRRGDR